MYTEICYIILNIKIPYGFILKTIKKNLIL